MKRFKALPVERHLLLAAACVTLWLGAVGTASAQYQWRDGQGRMVYSDLAPPTTVSPSQIIRAPQARRTEPSPAAGGPDSAPASGGRGDGAAATAAPAAGAPPTASLADRDMAYRKRLAEQAEAEKKAAAAQAQKIALAKACNDARGDIRLLESGQRVSRVNASGEREFINDRERAERLTTARKNIGERC